MQGLKDGAELLEQQIEEIKQLIQMDLHGTESFPFGHRFRFLHCMQELYCRLEHLPNIYNMVLATPDLWTDRWEDVCKNCENQIAEIIDDLTYSRIRSNEMYFKLFDEDKIDLLEDIEKPVRKINKDISKIEPEKYDEHIESLLCCFIEFFRLMREQVDSIRSGGKDISADRITKLNSALRTISERVNSECEKEFEKKKTKYAMRHHLRKKPLTPEQTAEIIRTEEEELTAKLTDDSDFGDMFLEFYQGYLEQPDDENEVFSVLPLFLKLYMHTGWQTFLESSIKYFYYYRKEQNLLLSKNANPTAPKQSRKRVKPEEEDEPRTSEVFTINAKKSNEGNFKILYSMITNYGWLRAESEEEFLRLFSGKANDCVITWIGKDDKGKKVGIGTLKELITKMIRQNIVTCVNNEYLAVIESHFKNEDGKYLTNVKGAGEANEKTRPRVDDLIRVLTMTLEELVAQSRGVDYSAPTCDATEGIDEEFSDIRYGQKQYWDDHKGNYD